MNNKSKILKALFCIILNLGFLSAGIAEEQSLLALVNSMDGSPGVTFEEGIPNIVPEGPGGAKATLLDGTFVGRIDLKPLGIDPLKFDLIKVEVKADRGASLRFSLENFPKPGQLSHWYVLDTARGSFDWTTIWIDLNKPEEVKMAGAYKGMGESNPDARGLLFNGGVKDLKRSGQGAGRNIWLGKIRFCRKAVDLEWDQSQFSYTWESGKDLVYTYPLTLINKLDKPTTVKLKATPFPGLDPKLNAAASFASEKVALGAGEKKSIEAKITLPAAVADKASPLYAERFEVRAAAEGIEDSEVTILSSSDPIHLSVVIPIKEDKLKFPLLPHKGIELAAFDEAKALREAETGNTDVLDKHMGPAEQNFPSKDRKLFDSFKKKKGDTTQTPAEIYADALTACAFLYENKGEKKYLEKGTALLLRAAELWPSYVEQWRKTPYTMISDGIFYRNILGLGWAFGGSRSAYNYDRHGVFNDFDLLAAGMDEATRKKIIDGLILPSALQMRGHYFGLTNQQDVINYPMLYAGLVARNWPLAALAYNSEHGVLGQIQWGFSDDGLTAEVNYHTPSLEPLTWATELLYKVGINVYDERFYLCIHSPAAKAVGKSYEDARSKTVAFLDRERFKPDVISNIKKSEQASKTDGIHFNTGLTTLRWNGLEVGMNWGEMMNRSAPDRCALTIRSGKETLGGGNYTHQSLGQSIIIIDESTQNSVPAEVMGVDVTGPVQYIQAASDKHYPGVLITRTFALVDKYILVVDRVISKDGQPHIVDWCFDYPGSKWLYSEVAKGISLPMKGIPGSFTTKPGEKSHGVDFGANLFMPKDANGERKPMEYISAESEGTWRQSHGNLMMLGEKATQVMAFAVPPSYSALRSSPNGVAMIMVRRKAVKETDFISTFSPDVKTIERLPVKTADRKEAQAIGVKVTLNDGKSFQAIVNYEPKDVEVSLGELKTKERFATDYK